ncbi:unnamed protein product, partial [Mesorhabditis spiculigera]
MVRQTSSRQSRRFLVSKRANVFKLKDASRSITRTLQNNFMDHSKQESFDLFLCGTSFENRLFDRAANLLPHTLMQEYPDAVEQLVDRSSEITNPEPIKVFCGTWNVNGGKNMYNVAFRNQERIGDWLFPHESDLVNICSDLESVPDIVAVGLEELVDLNAQNMVKASTTNQRVWLEGIRKALHEKAPYVLLGCEQLMGVCLYVFIRPRLAAALKDFSVGSVKTGMGGATANKGSVAFRMVVHSTSLCFVCSHFAAGQNEIRDRNEDWSTAMRKLRFPQGRDIGSSDVIFWFGDFNYRISMGREDVKRAVASGQFDHLVPNDQLTQQRAASNTFVGFEEGPLHFPPTYKYDTFSDDYDTSEKCRVPAWTDRVLWRDNRGTRASTKLLRYNRSELRTSDHRPVYASFEVTTLRVDWTKCEALVEDIVSSMGPPDGTVICSLEGLGSFPGEAVKEVLQRTRELGLQLLTSKVDGADLWLVFSSGECAIAALSMDGPPDWPDKVRPRLAQFDVTVEQLVEENEADYREASNEFIFDEEEDGTSDTISVSRLSMLSTGPPERPRPPSRGPPERPQRPASVVNPNIHVSSSAVQLATLDWPDDDSASSYSALSSSCPQRKLPHQVMPSRVAPPPPKHGPSRQSTSPESSMNGEPFSRSLNGFSTLKQPSDHYVLPPRLGAHDPFSSAWDDVGLTAGPAHSLGVHLKIVPLYGAYETRSRVKAGRYESPLAASDRETFGMDHPWVQRLLNVHFDFPRWLSIATAPKFDDQQAKSWIGDHFDITIQASIVYFFLIFGIKFFMRNREPFKLQAPLAVWNFFLAAFSIFGTYRLSHEFFSTHVDHGVVNAYTRIYQFTEGLNGYWVFLFICSKLIELVDTVFIVLRKKPLMFLHWYHHILTLIYAFYSYPISPGFNRYGIYLNFLVHSFMYSYYFIAALNIRLPSPVSKFITTIQIWQFIISIGALAHNGYLVYFTNRKVDFDHNVFLFASFMDMTYLALFINFFLKRYIFKKPKADDKGAGKKKKQ